MLTINSYPWAVVLCVVTMLCWGSWANTQKLASRKWAFQLFYWDYSIGVLLLSLILALTAGSTGDSGRSFFADVLQAAPKSLALALIGGLVFNLSNILIVVAIDLAGLAVAFPIGVGLALVIGVITNYIATPVGNAGILFAGVAMIVLAMILSALAQRKKPSQGTNTNSRGIFFSIAAGLLMGFFYRFVAASMITDFYNPEAGMLTPYTASVFFSLGLFLSSFIWNTYVMYRPFSGEKVTYADYFKQGDTRLHLIGILGGLIWSLGFTLNIIAAGKAGFAISYGLGQGATLIAALWGVFIWKEFKGVKGVTGLISLMFLMYLSGLVLIILARNF